MPAGPAASPLQGRTPCFWLAGLCRAGAWGAAHRVVTWCRGNSISPAGRVHGTPGSCVCEGDRTEIHNHNTGLELCWHFPGYRGITKLLRESHLRAKPGGSMCSELQMGTKANTSPRQSRAHCLALSSGARGCSFTHDSLPGPQITPCCQC